MKTTRVAQLPEYLKFVSDSQIVDAIRMHLDIDEDYSSFFIYSIPSFEHGDYAGVDTDTVLECIQDYKFYEVWGLEGIIPWNHKAAHKVLCMID